VKAIKIILGILGIYIHTCNTGRRILKGSQGRKKKICTEVSSALSWDKDKAKCRTSNR